MTRTIYALIALAVSYGALGLWGWREHEHRLLAEADVAKAELNLKLCQQAAEHQNDAILRLQLDANEAQLRAEAADEQAKASAAQAAKDHARMQALINKTTPDNSCDAAWDEIEQGG